MPTVSLTKKTSSHLPPNLTAHDQARKYPTGMFHVDDGLMFCLPDVSALKISHNLGKHLKGPPSSKSHCGRLFLF